MAKQQPKFVENLEYLNSKICSIACMDCGVVFKQKDKLLNHVKLEHSTMNIGTNETNEGKFTFDEDHHIKEPVWSCHCGVEFKRRGMMVNHILRLHPKMSLISACSALQEPLLRPAAHFHCPCCCKVYRSRTKRKHHVLRNHPGYSFPLKLRDIKGNDPLTSFNGTVAVSVSKCSVAHCQKQYTTRAKLIQHMRNKHMDFTVYESPLIKQENVYELESSYLDTLTTENIFPAEEETLKHQEMIEQVLPLLDQPSLTASTSKMPYLSTSTTENNFIPNDGMLFEQHALPVDSNLSNSDEIISEYTKLPQYNNMKMDSFTRDLNKEKLSSNNSCESVRVPYKNCQGLEGSGCNALELVEDYLVEDATLNPSTSFDISLSLNDDLNKDSYMIENMESLVWPDDKDRESDTVTVESFADSTVQMTDKFTLGEVQTDVILNRYKCHDCKMSFSRKFSLKQHNMSRHPDSEVKKYFCSKILKRPTRRKIKLPRKPNKVKKEKTLSNKMKNNGKRRLKSSPFDHKGKMLSVKNNSSVLQEVNASLNTQTTNRNAKDRHKNPPAASQSHSCALCPSLFPNKNKLNMHMLRHSDHREFSCPVCKQQFKRKDKYSRHMKLKHSVKVDDIKAKSQSSKSSEPKLKNGDWHCHCGVSFKRRGMIVNHIWREHPTVTPIVACPTLHRPLLRPDTRFHCPHCTKIYCSSTKRKQHILKNHPGCSLPPSVHNKGKGDMDTLTTRAGSVAINVSNCPIESCYKQYASHAKLAQHMRRKHPDRCSSAVEKISKKYVNKSSDVDVHLNSSINDSNHSEVELFSQNETLDEGYSIEIAENVTFVQGVDISCVQSSL